MTLFGTDGVRGRATNIEVSDPLHEYSENRLFSKELCGEIGYCASLLSGPGEVVIGWDRRPSNCEMASYLARRLSMHKGGVSFLGETSTPALQYELTSRGAALGIMITASHNPSSDSGLKLFLRNGRKLTRFEELHIESRMFEEDSGLNDSVSLEEGHCRNYMDFMSREIQACVEDGLFPKREILIDSSGGWMATWLVDLMTSHGVACREVSDRSDSINLNCGAASLTEGRLTWEECRDSNHALLREVQASPRGRIIGFCFDGDGDRCFAICSLGDSAIVVGGDGFLRLFLGARKDDSPFTVSLTIESSLDLSDAIGQFPNGNLIETGVGDRWLQHALIEDSSDLQIGSEPSGHVVLKHSLGGKVGFWGDGVATMLEFLRLVDSCGTQWIDILSSGGSQTKSGSVSPSQRSLWEPYGETGILAKEATRSFFKLQPTQISDVNILGEDGLLMMRFNDGHDWSVAIRNSGTEEKTRVTIRTTSEDGVKLDLALDHIISSLGEVLSKGDFPIRNRY